MPLCFTPRKLLVSPEHGTLLVCEADHAAVPYAARSDLIPPPPAEDAMQEDSTPPPGLQVRRSGCTAVGAALRRGREAGLHRMQSVLRAARGFMFGEIGRES